MNIKSLLKKMTTEEKVMQLCALMAEDLLDGDKLSAAKMKHRLKHGIGFLASVTRDLPPDKGAALVNQVQHWLRENTRLKIPAVAHEECLHGCMARGSTIFPQAIAMAASWDLGLHKRVVTTIGMEARAWGFSLALSPVVDVARDARAGRTEETFGEDTWLVTRFGVNFVKALQAQGVGCTPKHWVADFVADGGRDSWDIKFSERELREVYFPPYEACIREADARAIMPTYNTLNGTPMVANKALNIDVLRKEWGFKGIAGSDYWSIDYQYKMQFMARDAADAARQALMGGNDVEWPNSTCYPTLIKQVKQGKVPMKVLDTSVARVLLLKQKQGLFKNPWAEVDKLTVLANCGAHRELSHEAALKSIVLLKNKGGLPLTRNLKKVAVIGPNADEVRTGGYSSFGTHYVTPLQGIRERLGKERVLYAKGCPNTGGSEAGIKKAVAVARVADAAILVMGNWSHGSWRKEPATEGEGRDRCDLRLPGLQEKLIEEVCKVNKKVVVVLVSGMAVTMEAWLGKVKAVLNAWYPGCEGGRAIAETLFGDFNPGGKLPITFPVRAGQLPLYYNHKPTGRHYDYVDLRGKQAQFPFGHGLSYTSFKYSDFGLRTEDSGLRASCKVTNTGKRAGDEVVQLYIHQELTLVTRPLKELRGFERVSLAPGESTKVEFKLTKKDLAYLGPDLKPTIKGGAFEVMVGSSSEDIRLSKKIKLG